MKAIKLLITVLLVLNSVDFSSDAGSRHFTQVNFYGHQINVGFDADFQRANFRNFKQDQMTYLIKRLRNDNLYNMTVDIKRYKNRFRLDDIGTVILVDKITRRISHGKNNSQVFAKYLLLKDFNYDVVLTKTGDKLNVLGVLGFVPGRYVYMDYNKKRYVDLDFDKRRSKGQHWIMQDPVITRKKIYRDKHNQPRLNAIKRTRSLNFSYKQKSHFIIAKSNKSVTDFLGDLPMFDVGKEFIDVGMTADMEGSVIDYLKAEVAGMDQVEASKFLLAFVQQCVPYGSDHVKYGEERFYYPEETIMSVNADCEDKAMLLSYLTKNILNLNSISLYFENDEHLSVALEIPGYAPAGSFTYKGINYVPCEPTAKIPHLGFSQFDPRRITKITYM